MNPLWLVVSSDALKRTPGYSRQGLPFLRLTQVVEAAPPPIRSAAGCGFATSDYAADRVSFATLHWYLRLQALLNLDQCCGDLDQF